MCTAVCTAAGRAPPRSCADCKGPAGHQFLAPPPVRQLLARLCVCADALTRLPSIPRRPLTFEHCVAGGRHLKRCDTRVRRRGLSWHACKCRWSTKRGHGATWPGAIVELDGAQWRPQCKRVNPRENDVNMCVHCTCTQSSKCCAHTVLSCYRVHMRSTTAVLQRPKRQ